MKKFNLFILCLTLIPSICFGGWYYSKVESGGDVTAPEFSSATINGTALVINFSEAVTRGTGYNDSDIDLDMSTTGSNIGVTYVTGDGTSQWSMTAASAAVNGETVDLDFNGDADSIEDAAGNDLAALVSETVTNNTSAGYDIEDDFSGANNFVDLVAGSGVIISSGVLIRENNYAENFAYYNTDLGSANHCVRADVDTSDNNESGLMIRVNPTNDTGYIVFLNSANDRVYLESYSAGSGTFVVYTALGTVTITPDTKYDVLVTVSGSTFNVFVDWNDDGDYLDTDENPISDYSDSTYSTGNYVGAYFNDNNGTQEIDNYIGDATQCTP